MIPGSVILIGGDPGIGKSTLLLKVLPRLADQGDKLLYGDARIADAGTASRKNVS